jgi:hypothetical protein
MAKIVEEKEVLPASISINLKPFSNITYQFTDVNELDKDKIINDAKFWLDVLTDIEALSKTLTKPAAKPTVPSNIKVITKCPKCGSADLTYSTGTSSKTGRVWHAFDCGECTSSKDGKTFPTRSFADIIQEDAPKKKSKPIIEDDMDEIPF